MKFKRIVINTLMIGCLLNGVTAGAQSIKLVNPILSGFYPDPSIVKVGPDYYLVNSTFVYFPGLPLFHSKDLKNWTQLTNIIDRDSQMNFIGDRMTRGLFAPGISYNKGTFYVSCTNIDHRGNFVVTASNPAGPWSDPVWLPQVKGIDPSIFFDANKAYIVYNSDAPDNKPAYPGHRTIRMYELDIQNLKITGEEKILVNGGVDISKKPVWIEGPHILKRNDWYYLYAAEGGTSVNHSEVVFRSKRVDGPYVPYENNPILTQRDLPENRKYPVTSTGHAQFVEGPDQQTYAVFLGVRPYTGDYYNTGRETFIAPVEWKNDWPVINPSSAEVKYEYTAGYRELKTPKALPQSGNFTYTLNFDRGLDKSLLFLRSRDSASYTLNKQSGLVLKLKPETCMGLGSPAFVAKRQQHLICTAETALSFLPQKDGEKAGLVVFQDEKHFYFLGKTISGGKNVLQLYQSTGDQKTMDVIAGVPLAGDARPIQLRIDANGGYYSCYYATEPGKWLLLKDKLDAKFLSTHEAGGFIGCMFGLYATASGEKSENIASFKYLRYTGKDEVYQ